MSIVDVTSVLIFALVVPANLFPLLYGITAPWERTEPGRAAMTSAVALALLVDLSFLVRWLGEDYRFREWVTFGLVLIILAGSTMNLLALVRTQIKSNRKP